MLQIDVKLNPIADEGAANQAINKMLGDNGSVKPMVGTHNSQSMVSDMETYQEKMNSSNEQMNDFNDIMSKLKDSFKDVLSSVKSLAGDLDNLDSKLPETIKKARKEDPEGTERDLRAYKNDVNGVVGLGNNALATLQYLKRGDVTGAVANGLNTASDTMNNLAKSAELGGMGGLAKTLAKIAGPLALAGVVYKGFDELQSTYADATDGLDLLGQSFGGDDYNKKNTQRKALDSLRMRSKAVEYAEGTGMDTDSFIELASSLTQYGVGDIDRAGKIAKTSANWNRYTGAGTENIANFAGLMERYGGNGEMAIEQAYKAARVSGLDKNQFGEFLTGLQSVIENGISKGFVRSADDVSESLANISLMSGNDQLWSGKVGAQRYEQMGSAMSNATTLNSTSSMLLYQAVQNQTGSKDWLDIMTTIEKGDWGNKDFLDSYRKVLEGTYVGDRDQQIATIKENFGLNWTGAKDFYEKFILNTNGYSEEQLKNKMKEFTVDPTNKSEATNLQDALNKINDSLVNMGQTEFDIKLSLTEDAAKLLNANVSTRQNKKEQRIANKEQRIANKEANKEFQNRMKTDSENFNNVYGISYYGQDKDGNFISTTDKNEIISENPGITQISIADVRAEAKRDITTGFEIQTYNNLEEAIKLGATKDMVEDFLSQYAKLAQKGNKNEGWVFNSEAQRTLFNLMNEMLLALKNVDAVIN